MIATAYGGYAAIALVAWFCLRSFYRLYLHPLANIPGPRLAALSTVYEWYLDCVRPGRFCWEVQGWHRQYGDIIRIGPNEVHVDDPDWFDVLYSPNAKLDKDAWYYGFLGNHDSTFATINYSTHRVKRNKQNTFFSRQNVDRSAPIINEVTKNMLDQFDKHRNSGRALAIRNALKSYAADMVCTYCFPSAVDFVKAPDFSETFHDGQEKFARTLPWIRHFPLIGKVLLGTPDWLVPYLDKDIRASMSFIKFTALQVHESVSRSKQSQEDARKTIIREIHESDLPEQYRTRRILEQEALTLVTAGTATASRVLEAGVYYILAHPDVALKLTEELRAFKPDHQQDILSHRELESLPYLTAVVLECQRFIPASPSRFPRVDRAQDMFYKGYRIPKNTAVGMRVWDVLLSEKIWGNPLEFDPSRWLDPAYKTRMQKYMVAFGRGSRNCVGQNLAVAELYVVFGNLFRKFDMQLYQTGESEVECVQDCFEGLPYKGSVGVRVLLS